MGSSTKISTKQMMKAFLAALCLLSFFKLATCFYTRTSYPKGTFSQSYRPQQHWTSSRHASYRVKERNSNPWAEVYEAKLNLKRSFIKKKLQVVEPWIKLKQRKVNFIGRIIKKKLDFWRWLLFGKN